MVLSEETQEKSQDGFQYSNLIDRVTELMLKVEQNISIKDQMEQKLKLKTEKWEKNDA